ncbi:MAG: hypothetical protein ACP6IP_04530 [Candidatus Njordarchaeia archaeon]
MNSLKPEELYDKFVTVLAIWALGIKKEKVSGYIRIKFKRKDGKYLTLRFNIALKRIMIKKLYEVRGFIRIDVKKSVRMQKNLELKLDLSENKKDLLINMSYYLLASEGKLSQNFIKSLDSSVDARDEPASLVLPPFLPNFVDRLTVKIRNVLDDLEKAINLFKPDEIEINLKTTGTRSDLLLGEALGRAINLIVKEYADESNWRNMKILLKRHGGINRENVEDFFSRWEKGLKEFIKISTDYLFFLNQYDIDFEEGLVKGLTCGKNDKNLEKIINIYLHLVNEHLGKETMEKIANILSNKLGFELKKTKTTKKWQKLKDQLLKAIQLEKPYEAIKNVAEQLDKEETFGFIRYMLQGHLKDREKIVATIFIILSLKNKKITKIVDFIGETIINDDSLIGSLFISIEVLKKDNLDEIKLAYQKLARHVSRFAYSREILTFPYNVLIPISYETLAKLEAKLGLDDRADSSRIIARKILSKIEIPLKF